VRFSENDMAVARTRQIGGYSHSPPSHVRDAESRESELTRTDSDFSSSSKLSSDRTSGSGSQPTQWVKAGSDHWVAADGHRRLNALLKEPREPAPIWTTSASPPVSPEVVVVTAPPSAVAWSLGSELHHLGTCSPCAWYWKPRGCSLEERCQYCHQCTAGQLKQKRKEKDATLRQQRIEGSQTNALVPGMVSAAQTP